MNKQRQETKSKWMKQYKLKETNKKETKTKINKKKTETKKIMKWKETKMQADLSRPFHSTIRKKDMQLFKEDTC